MHINHIFFNLPPFVSTTWENVTSLHMRGGALVVTLTDGETITIPGLNQEVLENIFNSHAAYLQKHCNESAHAASPSHVFGPFLLGGGQISEDSPFKVGVDSLDNLGAALQHNPMQAATPDLPKEVLAKISAVAKIFAPDDAMTLPKPEPECNCMHCQIAKAIQSGVCGHTGSQVEVEDVAPEDLIFRQWDINQTGEKLYSVINRLDSQEKYSVYLGHPVGCTCGKQGCEHILAVLKS
jgi:hypothetical protein